MYFKKCKDDNFLPKDVFKLGDQRKMENIKYEKPALNAFCGWDSEFAVGGSSVIVPTCDGGFYEDPDEEA